MPTILKQTFFEAVIIVLLSLVLCLLVTMLRPGSPGFWRRAPEATEPSEQLAASRVITLAQAIERYDKGKTLFADARSPEDYAAGHVQGALSLPLYQFDEWIDEFLAANNPETPIVTYCGGANCDLARELAERFAMLGFEAVFFLEDGWGQWQAQGLPGATGPAQP